MSSLVFVDHLEQIDETLSEHSNTQPRSSCRRAWSIRTSAIPSEDVDEGLAVLLHGLRNTNEPLTGTAELMSNGRVMAEAPIEIAESTSSDPADRSVPVSGLAPGTYELRITVASGPKGVAESAYFTLQE